LREEAKALEGRSEWIRSWIQQIEFYLRYLESVKHSIEKREEMIGLYYRLNTYPQKYPQYQCNFNLSLTMLATKIGEITDG